MGRQRILWTTGVQALEVKDFRDWLRSTGIAAVVVLGAYKEEVQGLPTIIQIASADIKDNELIKTLDGVLTRCTRVDHIFI